jgi:hypothetical protein
MRDLLGYETECVYVVRHPGQSSHSEKTVTWAEVLGALKVSSPFPFAQHLVKDVVKGRHSA